MNKQFRLIIDLAALVVIITTAVFSVGQNHCDEYYQIIEFAQYKMGKITAGELPWEFQYQMRPSLQPWLAYIFIKSMHFIGIYHPFRISMILRALTGFFVWFAISRTNKIVVEKYFSDGRKNLFYISTLLLWFVPYISVRFSSENISAVFLLLSYFFLIKKDHYLRNLFFSGLMLGLACMFRYQIAFAAIGVFVWLLYRSPNRITSLAVFSCPFILLLFLGTFLDSVFYNEFTIAPYNYFKMNILEGKASEFGTSPWWYYIYLFLGFGVPPLSIILLLFFGYGIWKLRNELPVFYIVPFLLFHFIISHKEIRFLFPVSYFFILISIYGLDRFFINREVLRYHRILFRISVVINAVLLLYMLKPASEKIAIYRYLYNHIEEGNRTLLFTETKNYYEFSKGLPTTFYTPSPCSLLEIKPDTPFEHFLQSNHIEKCFYIHKKYSFQHTFEGYHFKKVFCVYPRWLSKLSFIDTEKIQAESIYLIEKN